MLPKIEIVSPVIRWGTGSNKRTLGPSDTSDKRQRQVQAQPPASCILVLPLSPACPGAPGWCDFPSQAQDPFCKGEQSTQEVVWQIPWWKHGLQFGPSAQILFWVLILGKITGTCTCLAGSLWLSSPQGLRGCSFPLSLQRELVTISWWTHCVLGGLPRTPCAQACAMSPLSWNSRRKNETDSLFTPQLFPASFFRLPLWHCFPRNYEAMKLLENSNTMHGLFIKKTIIEKRSCEFAQWKFHCGEEEKGMATGRVRFPPEMLTNWTGAGGEASIDIHTHGRSVRPYVSRCLCRSLRRTRKIQISF